VFVPPNWFWPIALVQSSIPFFLLYHLTVFAWLIRKGLRKVWSNALALAFGLPFLVASFGIPSGIGTAGDFQLLSYNVHGYRNMIVPGDAEARKEFYEWTVDHPAAIKVFQEFYRQKGNENNDTYSYFVDRGYHGYFEPLTVGTRFHEIGLAIFSRYPIVNSGRLFPVNVKDGNLNNIIFADIAFPKDTVRVYNAHFQSMGIDPDHIMETDLLREQYANVGKKFLAGSLARADQVNAALSHAQESPYPVLFAGDFNEMPYSYGYMKFRRHFKNAFERRGLGFGFSMNNRLWFLRIDNIFFDANHLEITHFKTRSDIKFSDHFPIEGGFVLGRWNR
jgi:endonuclease/exonuclease/phosphatase family metal-dependent hydrolase